MLAKVPRIKLYSVLRRAFRSRYRQGEFTRRRHSLALVSALTAGILVACTRQTAEPPTMAAPPVPYRSFAGVACERLWQDIERLTALRGGQARARLDGKFLSYAATQGRVGPELANVLLLCRQGQPPLVFVRLWSLDMWDKPLSYIFMEQLQALVQR